MNGSGPAGDGDGVPAARYAGKVGLQLVDLAPGCQPAGPEDADDGVDLVRAEVRRRDRDRVRPCDRDRVRPCDRDRVRH